MFCHVTTSKLIILELIFIYLSKLFLIIYNNFSNNSILQIIQKILESFYLMIRIVMENGAAEKTVKNRKIFIKIFEKMKK